MSEEKGSERSSSPRLCERCGSRMPPQKRGRPRRWCSQQCRQSAYEERHGVESWKDKQPKVRELSDVVEAAQDRAVRQETRRRPAAPDQEAVHTSSACVQTVLSDYVLMTFVVEHVTDIVRAHGVANTFNGRILAGAVAELVNAVLERTAAVVPVDLSRDRPANASRLRAACASARCFGEPVGAPTRDDRTGYADSDAAPCRWTEMHLQRALEVQRELALAAKHRGVTLPDLSFGGDGCRASDRPGQCGP